MNGPRARSILCSIPIAIPDTWVVFDVIPRFLQSGCNVLAHSQRRHGQSTSTSQTTIPSLALGLHSVPNGEAKLEQLIDIEHP